RYHVLDRYPPTGVGIDDARLADDAFGEAVFAEAHHLVVDALRELALVVALEHAVDELVAEFFEAALALPGGHRATQGIGFVAAEAGRDHRELHHLLLEDRHAERAVEHRAHGFARIAHLLLARAPSQVGMHHVTLDRARAHDRHLDHEIVVTLRP